jgi:hypothetical protein
METITFWCRTTFFLRYAGKLASAWITVAISAERFITIAYPLKVTRISTPTVARITILLIYMVCGGLGAYPYWTIGLSTWGNSTYCAYTDPDGYEIWSMVVLRTGSLFLPAGVIFILTILILVFLHRAKRQRNRSLNPGAKIRMASSRFDIQLTLMLICVALAFLILRLPYTVTFYLNNYKDTIWVDPPLDACQSYRLYIANKICDLLAITNYGVNFLLYCLCGSTFRGRLLELFSGRKQVKRVTVYSSSQSRFSWSSLRQSSGIHLHSKRKQSFL